MTGPGGGRIISLEVRAVARVFLSLGSNLGDREANLRAALRLISKLPSTCITRMSRVYQTAPWGVEEQPDFLDMAAEIDTDIGPRELLRELKQIERHLARVPGPQWSPRPIDIDILLFEGVQLQTPELSIPHPLISRRAFVLIPLLEIAPDEVLPDGSRIEDAARKAEGEVQVYGTVSL